MKSLPLVRKKTYSLGRNVNFLEISKLVMKRNHSTEDGGQKLTLADRALRETHIHLRPQLWLTIWARSDTFLQGQNHLLTRLSSTLTFSLGL